MEIKTEDGAETEFALQARMETPSFWRVTTHKGIAFGNEKLAFHVCIYSCLCLYVLVCLISALQMNKIYTIY